MTERLEILYLISIVAVHNHFMTRGFRQKNIKFHLELLLNWLGGEYAEFPLHNTQISRFLADLVAVGHVRSMRSDGQIRYALTRSGVLFVTNKLMDRKVVLPLDLFFLMYHFLKRYSQLLTDLFADDAGPLSHHLKLELQHVLRPDNLLRNQKRYVELQIHKLDERIRIAGESCEYAEELRQQKLSISEIAGRVQQRYPYSLNSYKPLKELILELTPSTQLFSMTTGMKLRAQEMFTPQRENLTSYLAQLERLEFEKEPIQPQTLELQRRELRS